MSENLFCPGQLRVSQNYKDGYYRTFIGLPKMSQEVKSFVKDVVEKEAYHEAIYLFTEKCGFDSEYAEFVIREFIDGNIE